MRRRFLAPIIALGLLVAVGSPCAGAEDTDPFAQFLPNDLRLNALRELLEEGEYAEAETRARQELSRLREEVAPDSTDLAYTLECLVESLWRAGKPDSAVETLALESLRIRETVHGAQSFRVQYSVLNLGVLYWQDGDFAKTQSYFQRNVELLESALGPDDVAVGTALNNLALSEWSLGDLVRAVADMQRSLAILEKELGEEHPFVAQSLGNLGMLLVESGDYAAAEAHLERAVARGRESLGSEHPEFARALAARGALLAVLGDYALGIECYEESLELREAVLGPDHTDVAESLIGLANLMQGTGDFRRAQHLYERGVLVRESALGPSHPDLASDLFRWAGLLHRTGASVEAIALYERALAIYEKAGVRGVDVARTLNQLGIAQDVAGRAEEARSSLRRALALWTEEGDHPEEAVCREHLASLHLRGRRFDAARQELERAQHLLENSLGPDHPRLASVYRGSSEVALGKGDRASALDLAVRSERLSREHVREVAVRLEERRAMRFAGSRLTGLDLALSLVSEDVGLPGVDRVLDAVVRSRAMVFDEMADRRRAFRQASDPESRTLWEELAAAKTRLANLLMRSPEEDVERYRQALNLAQTAKVAAERALAARSEAFRSEQKRSSVGLADVLARLEPEEGLVSYVRFTRRGSAEPGYLAFVSRGGPAATALVDLGSARAIDDRIRAWRSEAARGEYELTRSSRRSESAYREAGTDLRREIWDPLERHLENLSRVYVVFAGALHLVSPATLPVGQAAYLVERSPRIHILSTERDLVRADTAARTEGAGLLAVGGVAYDREPGPAAGAFRGVSSPCRQFRDLRFEPLPESAREVNDITSTWRAPDQPAAVKLMGEHASEAAFKNLASGKRVLHLATHGFFLGKECGQPDERSRREPSSRATTTPPITRSFLEENPLLLSGLALAGANLRDTVSPDDEDGILTAEEITALDLRGVEWAVLSGCDTGLGRIDDGEGVLGLRRAFLLAGARSVIMSLWAVEDEMARQWMTALYRIRREQDLEAADATHEASLALLRSRRARGESTHPFHWGAFLAIGGPPGIK